MSFLDISCLYDRNVDIYLLDFIDFDSLKNLFEVNKFYNKIIRNYPRIKKYYNFYCSFPKNKEPTYKDIIKFDDIDIFNKYECNISYDIKILCCVEYDSINIFMYIFKGNNYIDPYHNNIMKYILECDAVKLFNVYVKSINITDMIREGAVNILDNCLSNERIKSSIFNILSISIDYLYTKKIFEKYFDINAITENELEILIDKILHCDSGVFKYLYDYSINTDNKLLQDLLLNPENDYDIFMIDYIIQLYVKNEIIFDNLPIYVYFSNIFKYNLLYNDLFLESSHDKDIEIYKLDAYKNIKKLFKIAINICFDFTQCDLKYILINSVENNNYCLIYFIYDSSFNYKKYGFPEYDFDDEIMFQIARQKRYKYIVKLFLYR